MGVAAEDHLDHDVALWGADAEENDHLRRCASAGALQFQAVGARIIRGDIGVEDDRLVLVVPELHDVECARAHFTPEDVQCRLVGVVAVELEDSAAVVILVAVAV